MSRPSHPPAGTPPDLPAAALAGVAHELRNPLNAISAALEVLNRSPADAPRAVRAREVIARQIERMTVVIERLDAEPPAPPQSG